ncbi:hypothetical protein GUI12_00540 [Anaplasmataceae bacterium AB001_6]|nr:hypothetical protein GUI12_00540 [Anaplasmataceae bacterium AB001_6]
MAKGKKKRNSFNRETDYPSEFLEGIDSVKAAADVTKKDRIINDHCNDIMLDTAFARFKSWTVYFFFIIIVFLGSAFFGGLVFFPGAIYLEEITKWIGRGIYSFSFIAIGFIFRGLFSSKKQ